MTDWRVVTKKNGTQAKKVDVHVFDDTGDCMLALWECTASSAGYWNPSHTILLITNAEFKFLQRPTLSLNNETHVDVDPAMTDAEWLREYAQRLTKRECVNQTFPEGGKSHWSCWNSL